MGSNENKEKYTGSITVIFSLCFFLSLSLLCTILEAGRLYGMKVKLHMAAESALDSVFAGYQADILKEFGLLLLDTSFGEGELWEESVIKDFTDYMQSEIGMVRTINNRGINFFAASPSNIKIIDTVFITDFHGEIFADSVIQYMKFAELGNLVSIVSEQLNKLVQWSKGNNTINNAHKSFNELEFRNSSERLKGMSKEDATDENNEEMVKETINNRIIGKIKHYVENKLLDLVIPKERNLSNGYIQGDSLPSKSHNFASVGGESDVPLIENITQEVLFNEYLLNNFHAFTNVNEENPFQYELEYILCGKTHDRDNLMAVISKLLQIRTGLNMVTIMKSSIMRQEALLFATALVGGVAIPGIVQLTQILTMAAWACAESFVDIHTLLEGNKVPILKSQNDWNLSISSLNNFEEINMSTEKNENGLSYRDYLRLLFMFQQKGLKYFYTMDIIQNRIQKQQPNFRLDLCIYGLEVETKIDVRPLFFTLPLSNLKYTPENKLNLSCKIGRSY